MFFGGAFFRFFDGFGFGAAAFLFFGFGFGAVFFLIGFGFDCFCFGCGSPIGLKSRKKSEDFGFTENLDPPYPPSPPNLKAWT